MVYWLTLNIAPNQGIQNITVFLAFRCESAGKNSNNVRRVLSILIYLELQIFLTKFPMSSTLT
jgi:hypothetical protein